MEDIEGFVTGNLGEEDYLKIFSRRKKMSMRVRRVVLEGVNTKVLPKFAKFNSGGILVEGKWINVAKKVDISQFQKGETINIEIQTNDKGYDAVVGVVREKTSQAIEQDEDQIPATSVPPVPSLPKTSVSPKADPNGVSPVAPAGSGDKGLGKALSDGEKMTKAEWKEKGEGISIDAIHKSVLESPTLANMIIGKNEVEVNNTLREFLRYNLFLNQQAKNGGL